MNNGLGICIRLRMNNPIFYHSLEIHIGLRINKHISGHSLVIFIGLRMNNLRFIHGLGSQIDFSLFSKN